MSDERSLNHEEISLGLICGVLLDVLKQWKLILVVVLIAGMGAYVVTDARYTEEYTTKTTFVVSAGGTTTTTYQNLSAASNLASVFTEVLNSSIFLNEVMEVAGIESFNGQIVANSVEETNLLTMSVKGSDARTVFLMTKAIIQNHDAVTKQVLGNTILEVLQNPTVPVEPSNPIHLKNTVLKAMILTGALMCALIGGLSLFSDKVRSKAEADKKLQTHILGELFHERKVKSLSAKLKRQKTSILISNPFTSFIYTEAINKLSSRVLKRLHRDEKVLMIGSLLENEGKSTVAVNLALSIAKKGMKVLLIDCDLRKPACHKILGLTELKHSVMDVLDGQFPLDESVSVLSGGLHVLCAQKGLKTATNLVASGSMKRLLNDAKNLYDLVIVDTPPMSLAPDGEVLSEIVDAAILVVRQNDANASELNDAISILENGKLHLLGCVLNNVIGSGNFAPAFSYGSYGRYGKYGKYGRYGYGRYGYGQKVSDDFRMNQEDEAI